MTTSDELSAAEQAAERAFAGWDPVPDGELERARGIYDLRSIDTELAQLVEQSDALAGARGPGDQPEMLTFACDDITIEVEVTSDSGGDHILTGQIVPSGPAIVELQSLGAQQRSEADELGRFLFGVRSGPVRLVIELGADRRRVTTEFFRV